VREGRFVRPPQRGRWWRLLKVTVLHGCRSLGLFHVARRLTAGQLRILCYHGIAQDDEHRFEPGLFMRHETILSRMRLLREGRYPVLPLPEAWQRLRDGTLPPNAVAITFDDGFFSNYAVGRSLLGEPALPYTIYVTTYYVTKPHPIFRLVVRYMFWKTTHRHLETQGLPGMSGHRLDLHDEPEVLRTMWDMIRHAESHCSEDERVTISRELGARLGVDYDALCRRRQLSLMSPAEIRDLHDAGVDIQLHTHRHRLPLEPDEVRREVADNRVVLEGIVGSPRVHLCYPSGLSDPEHWPVLHESGIETATTCEPGLNAPDTPPYALRRFVDMETTTPIEFEAELCGLSSLLRRATGRVHLRQEPMPT
jgi:peptidoglycan/xylan/chitin deacetylase (PgdA/CDA1 family)